MQDRTDEVREEDQHDYHINRHIVSYQLSHHITSLHFTSRVAHHISFHSSPRLDKDRLASSDAVTSKAVDRTHSKCSEC